MRNVHVQGLMTIWGLDAHTAEHVALLLAASPHLRISSGRRTILQNARAGGVRKSFHLRGRAVDLVGREQELRDAAALARELRVGPRCYGPEEVILEKLGRAGQHLHVAW
jgi:hypothetical protein